MNYIPEIITLVMWPVLIIISYFACRWAVTKFKRAHEETAGE